MADDERLARLHADIAAALATARSDLKSSAKLPDGYAHGFANGQVSALTTVLGLIDKARSN